MSFNKLRTGLLISREPDGQPQKPHPQQQPECTASISVTTCSSSNNNNDEKMVCENSESPSSNRNGLNDNSQHAFARGPSDLLARVPSEDTNMATDKAVNNRSSPSNGLQGCKTEGVWDGLRVPRNQARLPGIIEDDVKVKNLFRKYKLSIQNETVILSRIDGILHSTGERSSLYKCHLCGKLGGTLEKLRRHLANHCRRLPFRCRLCDVRFQLRLQLSFHMKTQHGSILAESAPTEIEADDTVSGRRISVEDRTSSSSVAETDANAIGCAGGPGTIYAMEASSTVSHSAGNNEQLDQRGPYQQPLQPTAADSDASSSATAVRRKGDLSLTNSINNSVSESKYSFASFSALASSSFSSSSSSPNFSRRSNSTNCVLSPHSNQLDDPLTLGSVGASVVYTERPLQRGISRSAAPTANDTQYEQTEGMDMTCRSSRTLDHVVELTKLEECPGVSMGGSSSREAAPECRKNDLATKIRETEHLGDDVTVVIPSDAPIDGGESSKGDRGGARVNGGGGGGEVVEGGVGGGGTVQNKIIHAPHKSILGHSQLRTKRKPSLSMNIITSSSSSFTSPSLGTPTDSMLRFQSLSSGVKRQADEFPGHQMSATPSAHIVSAAAAAAGTAASSSSSSISSLPPPLSIYNPLALSNFVQGFSGLMSSPLLSPIIAQTPLGFPGMLLNPLSLYAAQLSSGSLASIMIPKVTAAAAAAAAAAANMAVTSPVECTQRDGGAVAPPGNTQQELQKQQQQHLQQQQQQHLDLMVAAADGTGRVKEELSNSNGSGCHSSGSDGYASPNSKCSSLSRTHSRLNVIQKPIKRENAYKPVIMSDGRTAYHCLYCNKNFCTISDVNRHMDFHEDIRPYKCRFCNYYARTNSQLKVHMMRHQGIREFLCRLCNYKGVTQSDLNRHTKSQIHMMKERNVCGQCREGFVSPMNLEQHRIEKHLKAELTMDAGGCGLKYQLTMAGLVKESSTN